MSTNAGEVVIVTKLDESGVTSGVKKVNDEFNKAGKSSADFGNIAQAGMKAVATAAAAAVAAVGGLVTAAAGVGMAFESSMSQVAATMGISADAIEAGSEEYKMLEEAAQKCGETTKFSASEAAQALNYLALAGYDAEKSVATLPKVLDLAAAGGMDLATASDMVTDSMAAMGLQTEELDIFIDEMAKTSQKSNTSVQQLGEATLVAAGAAAQVHMPIETLNTALGVMANNGIKSAEGGTHLRNIILSLVNPTDNASAALKQLGVSITDSNGDMRDLQDIVEDLNYALSDMGDASKAQMIGTIFNKTDIGAVNALLKSTNGEWQDLKANIENAAGAASGMATTMSDNLQGKITIMQSSMEGLGIAAYKTFEGPMKKGVEAVTNVIGNLTKQMSNGRLGAAMAQLGNSVSRMIEVGAEIAEVILPPIISGLSWLMDNLGIIATAWITLQASMAAYKIATEAAEVATAILNGTMMANPAGLLAAGIAALVTGMTALAIGAEAASHEMSEEEQEAQKLVDANKDLAQAVRESGEAFEESVESIENQAKVADDLADELNKLQSEMKGLKNGSDEWNDNVNEQERVIRELNAAYPDLNLSIDKQTGKLSKNTAEIKKNIAVLKQQAMAEAMQGQYKKIAEQKVEAAMAQRQANDAYKESTKAIEGATKALDDYYASTEQNESNRDIAKEEQLIQDIENKTAALEKDKEASEAADKAVADLEKQEATLDKMMEESAASTKDASETTKDLGDATEEAADKIVDANGRVKHSWDELTESQAEAAEEFIKTLSSELGLFDEWNAKSEISASQMEKRLKSQQEGLQNYEDNIEKLAGMGIDAGLLSNLSTMGMEGIGYINELAKAEPETIKNISDAWIAVQEEEANAAIITEKAIDTAAQSEAATAETTTTIIDEWGRVREVATDAVAQASEEATKSTAKVVTDEWGRVREVTDTEIKQTAQKNAQTAKSESVKVGEAMPQGEAEGISNTQSEAVDTAEQMCDEVVDTVEKDLGKPVFYTIGRGIIEGLIAGINASAYQLKTALNNLVKQALDETLKNLPSNIPSTTGGGSGSGAKATNQPPAMNSQSPLANQINSAVMANQSRFANNPAVESVQSNSRSSAKAASRDEGGYDTNVNVVLEGDAAGVFRLVKKENNRRYRATGRSELLTE